MTSRLTRRPASGAKNRPLAGKKAVRTAKNREDMLGHLASGAVFLCSVNRLKTVIAACLLAFWMPAASLCLMENAGWLAKNDGCCDPQSSEISPCCALASAAYKMDDNRRVALPAPAVVTRFFLDPPELIRPPNRFVCAESGVSPPELTQSWQFSFRAALTPRAPSAS
jgi:hypothetical protein